MKRRRALAGVVFNEYAHSEKNHTWINLRDARFLVTYCRVAASS